MATPNFGRSVNPISTKGGEGGRLCPSNNTGTPGFSDLVLALDMIIDFVTVNSSYQMMKSLWKEPKTFEL